MSRHPSTLLPPMLVNTPDALDEMLYRLWAASAVAVDTESNSLYAYTERVCLIQFSVPGEDYLVDPLALDDLSALGAVFADDEITKVFHAAEYDVMALRRDYRFTFASLFDTMIASRIVGWERYGLAALLEEHFGIEVLVPEKDGQATIDRIIYNELCQGKVKAHSRRTCVKIISSLVGRGAQGIVLGCTELALLIRAGDVSVPLFDTTRLHVEAAVNMALAGG